MTKQERRQSQGSFCPKRILQSARLSCRIKPMPKERADYLKALSDLVTQRNLFSRQHYFHPPKLPSVEKTNKNMSIVLNEPLYCLCRQPAHGLMMGCDNSECQIRWFHFECVGLNTKPTRKWYCPSCKV